MWIILPYYTIFNGGRGVKTKYSPPIFVKSVLYCESSKNSIISLSIFKDNTVSVIFTIYYRYFGSTLGNKDDCFGEVAPQVFISLTHVCTGGDKNRITPNGSINTGLDGVIVIRHMNNCGRNAKWKAKKQPE